MPLKDPITQEPHRQYSTQYYSKNRKRILQERRNNRDKIKEYDAQRWKNNFERLSKQCREYNKTHRVQRREAAAKNYQKNKDKIKAYTKQYQKDHPEVQLKSKQKSFKNMGLNQYETIAWARVIRKDKNCNYCGSDKNLHAHHIFPKARFPGLALNENNGIPLCVSCHKEHHMLNGVN